MKKIILMIVSMVLVLGLAACEDVCVGPECITGETTDGENCGDTTGGDTTGEDVTGYDKALPMLHINGEGHETEKVVLVLYEYSLRDYVKYQITYLSCTCRPADYNYWNVGFVEINKSTNDIRTISFNEVPGEHYSAGVWGDSSPTPAGKTLENFETDFLPWLVGKSLTDLDGISVFTNEPYHGTDYNTTDIAEQNLIDDFAGSSVSTNNMIRAMKALLEYHEENYN